MTIASESLPNAVSVSPVEGDSQPTDSQTPDLYVGSNWKRAGFIPRLTAGLTLALSLFGLLGWLTGLSFPISFGVGQATMKFNAALTLALIGGGQLALLAGFRRAGLVQIMAYLAGLLSGLTLLEYGLDVDLGIDQLVVRDPQSNPLLGVPGRMASLTAGCFFGLSGSLLALAGGWYARGQLLSLMVLLIAYGIWLGHLFGLESYYAFGYYSSVARPTCVALLVAAVGLLSCFPRRGLLQTMTSSLPGGILARYVVAYVLLVPALLLAGGQWAVGQGWFSSTAAMLIAQFLVLLLSLLFFLVVARRINRLEGQTNQQAAQMTGILANTLANITLLAPIVDDAGQILDYRYIFTNEANARAAQRTIAQLMNSTLLGQFPGIRDTEFFTRLEETTRTGTPNRFLFPYQDDGISGWFDVIFQKQGEHVLFTSLDVTALKKLEAEQTRQTQLLSSIIDGSLNGIVALEAVRDDVGEVVDFRILLTNAILANMVGTTIAEMQGQLFGRYFPSYREAGIMARYVAVIETGQPFQDEVFYPFDGVNAWFSLSAHPIGKTGVSLTFLDITAHKNAELALQQQNVALLAMNTELERSNQNLQEFAYVASHDLQEPLRKITAFGTVLTEQYGPQLDESATDLIRRMQLAATRMSVLIKDLLSYSRIATQRAPLGPVCLPELLTELTDDLLIAIRESGAIITWDEQCIVQGDRGQLRQLFQNLLSNAIKFRRRDSPPQIRVQWQRIAPSAILQSAGLMNYGNQAETYVEIRVIDNGIGFDEKYLDRIFGVFQRLHTKTEYAGTGVGLAICQRIAQNHQGAITAVSQPGVGATFIIYLPGLA